MRDLVSSDDVWRPWATLVCKEAKPPFKDVVRKHLRKKRASVSLPYRGIPPIQRHPRAERHRFRADPRPAFETVGGDYDLGFMAGPVHPSPFGGGGGFGGAGW